jgi:GNAT superfamily N-acetyltransferase
VAISFTERETKYPERLLETDDKSNRQRYGVVLRRFVIGGHRMELRAESQPAYDGMDTIVVLDGMGQIAARGDNEWGATLLRVAKEYRGIGLGRVLARAWYDINPSSVSGGFTSAGRRNAVSAWETRVREFLANGWYSALVRAGRMEKSRVDEILSGLSKKRPSDFLEMPADQGERRSLVYVDDDGIAFVLYDARFLDEPDEKWILAYGFLRESSGHGAYFYRMEYEPDVELVATAIALQLARDNGEQLYVGSAPGDMVPWELIPEAVEEHDGHIEIVRDLIPLRTMARQERSVRGPRDPYGQRRDELLELAESKWS